MAAVNESDSSLTNKCLDLCHALAGQGKVFKFSLTIGSTFTFSLDSREDKEILPKRKRKSPSTLRRNAKRREDFLKKKSTSESASATGLESNQKPTMQRQGFQCDDCDFQSKSENGLKIHKGKSHKEVRSPEKLRKVSIQPSLLVSPTRNENRVEPCHNCDMDMSPSHLCQDEEDSGAVEADEAEEAEAPIICGCGCGAPERCPRHFEVMESRKQMLSLILEQTKQFNQFNLK